ncbi:MAG: hypothetical protein K8R76_12130 [Candidatus Aegiribacteria sp.]|nr:hypothetical protein [Candidatus Aegiribacteria sp.]
MNSCSRSTSVLSYLMGEQNESDRSLFEKHLEGCPICQRELKLERSLQNGLVECTLQDAAPPDLKLNVLSKILTMRPPQFPIWQMVVTLLSGAALFTVLLRILHDSSVPETGIELLSTLIDNALAAVDNNNSVPLMIGVGIVLMGILSVVASLVQEE